MNETIKLWLVHLFKDELRQVEGEISNQRIWASAADAEDVETFLEGIEYLEEYKQILEDLLAKAKKDTLVK